jgi:phosphohistidine swiveling domain-containing protein
MGWKFFGEWENAPFFYCLFWNHLEVNRNVEKYFKTPRKVAFFIFGRKNHFFVDSSWIEELREEVYSAPPKKIIKELEAFYPEFKKVKSRLFTYYGKEHSGSSDKQLNDTLQDILKNIRNATSFSQYSMISELCHMERFKEELEKFSEDETHISILCMPVRRTSTQEKELSLIEMALKKPTKAAVRKHVKLYGWLPVFLFGKAWDEPYILDEIRRLRSRKDLKNERDRIKFFPREQKAKIKELHKKLNSSKKLIELSEVMQEISFIRNEAETMVSLGSFVLRPIYKEIAKRTGLKEEQWCCLTPEEIGKILLDHKDFSREIEERLQGSLYASSPDSYMIRHSDEAIRMFKEVYKKPEQKDANSLKGMCASVGEVSGRVHIVNSIGDMNTFEDGDILVSEATCIDFVPVMRRAAAILTEMGGITSHAALVSRELQVPCIVGIPGLLKALKNGQKVHVNANKGSVTLE